MAVGGSPDPNRLPNGDGYNPDPYEEDRGKNGSWLITSIGLESPHPAYCTKTREKISKKAEQPISRAERKFSAPVPGDKVVEAVWLRGDVIAGTLAASVFGSCWDGRWVHRGKLRQIGRRSPFVQALAP